MNNTKQTNKGDLYNLIGGVVEGYLEELSADNYMMIDHLTEVINDEVQKKVEEGVRGFIKWLKTDNGYEKEFEKGLLEHRAETYINI